MNFGIENTNSSFHGVFGEEEEEGEENEVMSSSWRITILKVTF